MFESTDLKRQPKFINIMGDLRGPTPQCHVPPPRNSRPKRPPTGYRWSYNPYSWPDRWVTVVITPLNGAISLLTTGFWAHLVGIRNRGEVAI